MPAGVLLQSRMMHLFTKSTAAANHFPGTVQVSAFKKSIVHAVLLQTVSMVSYSCQCFQTTERACVSSTMMHFVIICVRQMSAFAFDFTSHHFGSEHIGMVVTPYMA